MSYDHIRNAPGYAALIKKAQAALDVGETPWEVQKTWTKEQHRAQFVECFCKGKSEIASPIAIHDGLVFVEHPIYGDEDSMQIMHADGTFSPSHAYDMDDLRHGDY